MSWVEISEGALILELDAERCLKWDAHAAYTSGIGKLSHTKAVDVCASVAGDGAIFLELKDFRAEAIQNARRLTSGDLAREVAEKVRDTLAGLIWACGRGLGESDHERLVRDYLERRKFKVVLWLEEDVVDIGGASALQDQIRAQLKPHIESDVYVTSTLMEKQSNKPLPWLRVRGLPAPRIASRPRGRKKR